MRMHLKHVAVSAFSLMAAAPVANGHTWVEFLYRITDTGTFTGPTGYPIGYVPRAQGVPDDVHQNKILDTSTNPVICKPMASSDNTKYPPLTAAPGDYIAMQYQENGHVTQPKLTVRPYRGGNVYVYGTLHHEDTDGINDVLDAWTVDGKGGNQKGKLLATHYFDDLQCFQDVPNNAIAQERSAKYGVKELFCQTDLQLPVDLPTSGTYTLMWVWDWPQILSDTRNVTEIYTTCAQINLTGSAKSQSVKAPVVAPGGNINSMAIQSQLQDLVEATALGVGTNSPAPVTVPIATDQSAPVASTNTPVVTSVTPTATASVSQATGHSNVMTVTVTAAPQTVTQLETVVMSVGGSSATSYTQAPSQQVTTPAGTFPTSIVPVSSVRGFLPPRALRVTGQARREYRPEWY